MKCCEIRTILWQTFFVILDSRQMVVLLEYPSGSLDGPDQVGGDDQVEAVVGQLLASGRCLRLAGRVEGHVRLSGQDPCQVVIRLSVTHHCQLDTDHVFKTTVSRQG